MFTGNYEIKLNDKIRQRQQTKVIKKENEEKANNVDDFQNKFGKEHHGIKVANGIDHHSGESADEITDKAVAEMMGSPAPASRLHKKGYEDVDPEGEYGIGDLMFAAGQGNLMRVRQIVECVGGKESNVNKTKWSGVTCLHRAAGEGHHLVVEYLVKECKMDLDTKTTFGWHTPLHFACRNGREEAAIVLIDAGALWQVHNKDRETPMNWARVGGHAAMGRRLEQLQNKQSAKGRKQKMKEMERMYAERAENSKREKLEEEEEARRLKEEEEKEKQRLMKESVARRGVESAEHLAKHYDGEEAFAQLPVNLPMVTYTRRGRKSHFIYNQLINRSRIVAPRRYGADSDNPSVYVTRNKLAMAGVTDSVIKHVGELSRHMRNTSKTKDVRISAQIEALNNS